MRRVGRKQVSCDQSLCCSTQAWKHTEEWILLNFHFTTMQKQDERNVETTWKMLDELNLIDLLLQHSTNIHGEAVESLDLILYPPLLKNAIITPCISVSSSVKWK